MTNTKKTYKPQYNKSVILKRAWILFREGKYDTFGEALKQSWSIAKHVPDFNTIYKKYYNKTYVWVLHKTFKNVELAQEITQDTFIKVYENLNTFDPNKAQLHSWIITIANRLIIDNSRTKAYKNNQRTYNDIDDTFSDSQNNILTISTYEDASDMLEGKELRKHIDNIYSNMKPMYAQVHKLFVDGHKYREIGDMLGMDINLVAAYVMRAKKILKEGLTKKALQTI